MGDHVKRMRAEAMDLMVKIGKIREFIQSDKFNDLSKEEKDLMLSQRDIMVNYCAVLDRRIELSD